MTKDRSQLTPTPVRIPLDVKAPLQAAAKANDRSLNGEILARLRASLLPTAPEAQKGTP